MRPWSWRDRIRARRSFGRLMGRTLLRVLYAVVPGERVTTATLFRRPWDVHAG